MEKKVKYTKGEFNCAETIIDAFNKNNSTSIPVSLGSGMGSGMTVGSLCGAINAAVIVIGYLKGRENFSDPNEARALCNQLLKDIKREYNSEICIDLKKSGISCQDIVEFTYLKLEEILSQNKG